MRALLRLLNEESKDFRVYIASVIAMIFWGYICVRYKQAFPEFQPINIISFPLLLTFSLIIKKIHWPRYRDFRYFLLVSMFEPLLYFLPFFLLIDSSSIKWWHLTIVDFLLIIYLGVFVSTVFFVLFAQGVKSIGIAKSMVFTNFIPVVIAIIAMQAIDESMTLLKATGILITIFGLFMSQAGGFPKIRICSRVKKR